MKTLSFISNYLELYFDTLGIFFFCTSNNLIFIGIVHIVQARCVRITWKRSNGQPRNRRYGFFSAVQKTPWIPIWFSDGNGSEYDRLGRHETNVFFYFIFCRSLRVHSSSCNARALFSDTTIEITDKIDQLVGWNSCSPTGCQKLLLETSWTAGFPKEVNDILYPEIMRANKTFSFHLNCCIFP